MSKALQRHLVLHFPEEAEGEGGDTIAKAQPKKNDGKKKPLLKMAYDKILFPRNDLT